MEIKSVEEDNTEEVFGGTSQLGRLSPDQLVTVQVAEGNFVLFQPDTEAQCNVLLLQVYEGAIGDTKLEAVDRSRQYSTLVAYGGSTVNVYE